MVKRDLIRNIIIAVLAIVVILLLRAFVFSTHRVTENQANDYIHAGDYVTFNKNVEPQKKDFILYTVNGKDYIGRVIAGEGKSVTAMDDFLYVNDKSVDEAYISKDKSAYLATVSPGNFFTDDFSIATETKFKKDCWSCCLTQDCKGLTFHTLVLSASRINQARLDSIGQSVTHAQSSWISMVGCINT